MLLNAYLADTFRYNDVTNKNLLTKIAQLTQPEESVKLFSHLINSQYKWMARIMNDPANTTMSWWDPVYPFHALEQQWTKSLQPWLDFIAAKTEKELLEEVQFTGYDGGTWAATPADIMLQLNYHSIHHRAQIQTLLRRQNIEPDFVDYIGTKYKKIS